METKEIFEEAKMLFYKNKDRGDVIDFINSKGILGEEANQLATKAYKSIKPEMDKELEIEEHKSLGGPFGKIAIGILAIGIGVFGVIALETIFYIVFLIGIVLIGSGIIGIFNNPEKNK